MDETEENEVVCRRCLDLDMRLTHDAAARPQEDLAQTSWRAGQVLFLLTRRLSRSPKI